MPIIFQKPIMFIAGAGVTLISTFAPDVMPDFWRTIGFFTGIVLMLVAGGMLFFDRLGRSFTLPFRLKRSPDRIPLLEFRDIAKGQGWDFGNKSLEGMDLSDAIQQAALDGVFIVWGKPNRNDVTSLTRNERLHRVDADLWKDLNIDVGPLYSATDNFEMAAYNPRQSNIKKGSYVDLHVERRPACKWLKRGALEFKGRRDAAEATKRH